MKYRKYPQIVATVVCLALSTNFVYAVQLSSEHFSITSKSTETGNGITFTSENYSVKPIQVAVDGTPTTPTSPTVSSGASGHFGSKIVHDFEKPNTQTTPEFILGSKQDEIPLKPFKNVPTALQRDVLEEMPVAETIQNNFLNTVNTRSDNGRIKIENRASLVQAFLSGSLSEYLSELFETRTSRALVFISVLALLFLIRKTPIGRRYSPF